MPRTYVRENDTRVVLKLPQRMKDQFDAINKSRAINASALIRQWIEQYIRENSSSSSLSESPIPRLKQSVGI